MLCVQFLHGQNQPEMSSSCSRRRDGHVPTPLTGFPWLTGVLLGRFTCHGYRPQARAIWTSSLALCVQDAERSHRMGSKNRSLDLASWKTPAIYRKTVWMGSENGSQMAVGWEGNGRWWSWDSKSTDYFFKSFGFLFFVIKKGEGKVDWTHPAIPVPPSRSFPHTLHD